MCYKNYLSCHIFKNDGLWMLKVVNILDGEETVRTLFEIKTVVRVTNLVSDEF